MQGGTGIIHKNTAWGRNKAWDTAASWLIWYKKAFKKHTKKSNTLFSSSNKSSRCSQQLSARISSTDTPRQTNLQDLMSTKILSPPAWIKAKILSSFHHPHFILWPQFCVFLSVDHKSCWTGYSCCSFCAQEITSSQKHYERSQIWSTDKYKLNSSFEIYRTCQKI